MIYTIIDTNIWIRVISQGKPGCELEHFNSLRRLVEEGAVVLIVPEVVELELEKAWRDFKDDVNKHIGLVEKRIEEALKGNLWSEIEDVRIEASAFLKKKKEKKTAAAETNFKSVQRLFQHPKILKIPLTPELLFLGRKRLIAGRMPISENKAHNDACIVESLVAHFRAVGDKNARLYFCSENEGDFALPFKDSLILHPLVRVGLPATQYSRTLKELIEFHQNNGIIHELSQAEIDDALERSAKAAANPAGICAAQDCTWPRWAIGPFCASHFHEHIAALASGDREDFYDTLEQVLKTLKYREREVFKLRTGIGDGYVYTRGECARIFKCHPATIGRVERTAFRKMQHPVRARALERFF